MMASELRHDGEITVTTNDLRRVTLQGDEALADEMVRWWDHFKRMFVDKPICPFCEMPVLLEYEEGMSDPLSKQWAHKACVEDWQTEAERELHFQQEFDQPLPPIPEVPE